MSLFDQLFLHLFPTIKFTHVCNFLSFVDFFLHQPVIHRFGSVFVLVPFLLCHIQKLFFDLVLGLANQFAFKSLFRLFAFQPVAVR